MEDLAKEELIKQAVSYINNYQNSFEEQTEKQLTLTKLQCYCGGYLNEVSYKQKQTSNPRYSKRSRLRKKFKKIWANKNYKKALFKAVRLLRSVKPGFECSKCLRCYGFYNAVGYNLFSVQKMPDGALPIYNLNFNMEKNYETL